jgi:hydrogenase nickel incorporation protein HypA/HybF
MHEFSIVQSLVDRVEAEARVRGATKVRRVSVRIGELSGVEAELLERAYDVYRERTICHDAALEIRRVPAKWTCPRCAADLARLGPRRCAACGTAARLAEGDDIVLEQIEMEVA